MKYSIIIPTYKRQEKLKRAIQSVLDQKGNFDIQIIIINDSPDYDYSMFESWLVDMKNSSTRSIVYNKNTENKGVNFSRNYALTLVAEDSSYVIFLDDDDWFEIDALGDIDNYLRLNKGIQWLLTNRVKQTGESLTTVSKNKKSFNYFLDYLVCKCIMGDATHIIKKQIATSYKFSNKIKNGEEWFYFIQIPSRFSYKNLNSTKSEGYSDTGLNVGMQKTYKINTRILWSEITGLKMFVYISIRSLYDTMGR